MSRPLRIVEPNAWHHVMNRGGARRRIFLDDQDRSNFLDLVQAVGRRFGLYVVAYCLMDNHYHLLLFDEHGTLDRGMQHFGSRYTQQFNGRHQRDGALFRGRYRSRLVQREVYAIEVVRYLHFNPVEAGIVKRAGDYPWSSHRAYLGQETVDWVRRDLMDPYLGDLLDPDLFDRFVHERADEERARELSRARWAPVIGTREFMETNRTKVRTQDRFQDTEIRDAAHMAALDPRIVIDAACEAFELDRNTLLLGKRGTLNLPRLITVLACRELTTSSNHFLGVLIAVSGPSVSSLVRDARRRLGDEPEAVHLWQKLMDQLQQSSA